MGANSRGTLVIARDYKGDALVRRVWETCSKLIYLSDEVCFQQLSTGMDTLRPIGFPAEDVFTYDPAMAQDIASGSVDWSSLRPVTANRLDQNKTDCVK